MSTQPDTLDVRNSEEPPFVRIDSALSELEAGDQLTLVNGFEPEPLYDVLESRGFTFETTEVADDEWHVLIERPE